MGTIHCILDGRASCVGERERYASTVQFSMTGLDGNFQREILCRRDGAVKYNGRGYFDGTGRQTTTGQTLTAGRDGK